MVSCLPNHFIAFRVMERVYDGQRQVHPWMSCPFIIPRQCSVGVLATSPYNQNTLHVLSALGLERSASQPSSQETVEAKLIIFPLQMV